MHMWASDEVCAGIFTLLCMLSPLIKRDHQEKEECEECNMRNGLGTDVYWPSVENATPWMRFELV